MSDRPNHLSDRGTVRLSREEWNGKNGLRDGKWYSYLDYKGLRTIGIGHLVRSTEDFSQGLTADEVMALFHRDLGDTYAAIARGVAYQYDQASFDSLVITGHNLGTGFFVPTRSSCIMALNANDLEGYCSRDCDGRCTSRGKPAHLQDWNRSGSPPKFDPNLFERRKRERTWFFEDPPTAEPLPAADLFSDWERQQVLAGVAVSASRLVDDADEEMRRADLERRNRESGYVG